MAPGVTERRDFGRTICWLALTAVLLILSAVLQSELTLDNADPFFRSMRWLMLCGLLMLSAGVVFRGKPGGIVLTITGAGGLLAGVLFFLFEGGMETMTTPGTDLALNLMMAAWTALPLACLVYSLVSAFSLREDSRARRVTVCVIALALAVVFIVLAVTGHLLPFVHLEQTEG